MRRQVTLEDLLLYEAKMNTQNRKLEKEKKAAQKDLKKLKKEDKNGHSAIIIFDSTAKDSK